MDPVYKAVTIGLGEEAVDLADITSSRLRVILERTAKVPASVVKSQIQNILETYFNPINITLGFTVSVTDIASEILALNGVKEVQTINGNLAVNGVSFIVYNPSYPQNDIISTTKNFTVQSFQTVYLDNINEIMTRVEVVPEVNQDTSIINF
jgi:type III secretory pathway lipoprotein EscJ